MDNTATLDLARLIDRKEVERLAGIKRSTLWKWVREGRLPAPIKLGSRCCRWRAADILNWLAAAGTPTPAAPAGTEPTVKG